MSASISTFFIYDLSLALLYSVLVYFRVAHVKRSRLAGRAAAVGNDQYMYSGNVHDGDGPPGGAEGYDPAESSCASSPGASHPPAREAPDRSSSPVSLSPLAVPFLDEAKAT